MLLNSGRLCLLAARASRPALQAELFSTVTSSQSLLHRRLGGSQAFMPPLRAPAQTIFGVSMPLAATPRTAWQCDRVHWLSTSTNADGSSDDDLPWHKRAMQKIKAYGRVGLGTYFLVDGTSILILTALIYEGVDVVAILERFGVSHSSLDNVGNSLLSAWAIAVAVNKITVPIRLPITLYLTPKVYRWWHGRDPLTPEEEAQEQERVELEEREADTHSAKEDDTRK